MGLLCNKCMFSREVPGNTHIECIRKNVKLTGAEKHGIDKGWFYFPVLFDPIWGSECDSFVDKKYKRLSEVSDLDIFLLYIIEKQRYSVINDSEKIQVRKENNIELLKNETLKTLSKSNELDFDIRESGVKRSEFESILSKFLKI